MLGHPQTYWIHEGRQIREPYIMISGEGKPNYVSMYIKTHFRVSSPLSVSLKPSCALAHLGYTHKVGTY